MPRKPKYQSVVIEWLDAIGIQEQMPLADARKLKPARCRTTGWLISDFKNYVVVAQDLYEDGTCNGNSVVPRAMLLSLTSNAS